jgi:Putative abortive phage resistance protein AbiGi, antitoxin
MSQHERRFFYHSFPRPRREDSPEKTISKGIEILRSIKEIGFLLAPEIVKWDTPVSIGSKSPILIPQLRISFTEIKESELPKHANIFGPFALEFDLDDLRKEGAMPVIYAPQARGTEDHLSLTGAIIVSHLRHINHLVSQLQSLTEAYDAAEKNKIEKITLNNLGDKGEIVQSYEISIGIIRELINFLSFKNAPFKSMIGVLHLMQSLFYPTDNEHLNDDLAYYRQREWRITGGYNVNSRPRSRPLTQVEKERVLTIDAAFWSRKDQIDGTEVSRIDRAQVLNQFRDRPLVDDIRRIIVPKSVESIARELFGDKVLGV